MDDFDREELEQKQQELSFGKWLQLRYSEFVAWSALRNNRSPSYTDWARYLGITNTNLSQYLNNNRKPDHKQADLLAAKLGPEVYDRLGMPRKMPKDKLLYFVADNWHLLSEEEKKEVVERAKNRIAERKQREQKGGKPALT